MGLLRTVCRVSRKLLKNTFFEHQLHWTDISEMISFETFSKLNAVCLLSSDDLSSTFIFICPHCN